MLKNVAMLTTGVFTTLIAYDYLSPNIGYIRAKHEIQEQAKRAAFQAMDYIDRDLRTLELNHQLYDSDPMKKKPGEVVLEEYTKGKVEILLAPQYRLRLLGDDYVVKWPHKDGSNAWLLREEDAKAMEDKIIRIVELNGIANPSEQKRTVKKIASDGLVNTAKNSMAKSE